jgi:hypothetical protein
MKLRDGLFFILSLLFAAGLLIFILAGEKANAGDCIVFSGTYNCDGNVVMKIYSSEASGIYTYRFGVVDLWDFIADGANHPMMKWPTGSTYSANCGAADLDLHQVWLNPPTSEQCKGVTEKIVYASHLEQISQTMRTSPDLLITDQYTFEREETHYCSGGEVVHIPALKINCALAPKRKTSSLEAK